MKGFLIKDFMMSWKVGKLLLLMMLVFPCLDSGGSMFLFYGVALAAMLPVTLLAYDEAAGWLSYVDCLPRGRERFVAAKYILGLLAVLLSGGMTALLGDGAMLALVLPAGLTALALLLPLNLYFGTKKARVLYYVLLALSLAAGTLMDKLPVPMLSGLGLGAFPAAGLALFAMSWVLSVRLYKDREL